MIAPLRATFPRAQRLRKRAEFQRVQTLGARVSARHFLILLLRRDGAEGPGREPARLGVVASRKVGGAVARNRAKRLVREVFRLHPEVFPAQTDVVIVVRPGADRLAYRDAEREICELAPLFARRAAAPPRRRDPETDRPGASVSEAARRVAGAPRPGDGPTAAAPSIEPARPIAPAAPPRARRRPRRSRVDPR